MGINCNAVQALIGQACPPGLVQSQQDVYWMTQALRLADYAESLGEVPVGAVLVKNHTCISVGYNHSISSHDPTGHAEIMALKLAGKTLENYRLPGSTLYVTLEPCAMCATAMVHARISRLVFGATDLKTGAAGSVFNLVDNHSLNHQVQSVAGVLAEECAQQLSHFFKRRRAEKKQQKTTI